MIDQKIYHYVYKTTNLINQKIYIGKHSTQDIDDDYLGSGFHLKRAILKYGKNNFKKEILKYFVSSNDAYNHERNLVNDEFILREDTYNISIGGGDSPWIGTVSVKDKNGNNLIVSVNDPRYISGELLHSATNRAVVKDKEGNNLSVSIDDPRYLEGELVGATKGHVSVKDKNGKTMFVSINDPRYLSGELVFIQTGMINIKDKFGNTGTVNRNDPRYLSGELASVLKGCKSNIKGKTCTTNGEIDRFIFIESEEVSKGFWIGSCSKGKKSITNGKIARRINLDLEEIPEGFWLGNMRSIKNKMEIK